MKRISAILASLAFALTALTACSSSSIESNTTISIAELAGFNSINADNVTTLDAARANLEIANLTRPTFFYTDESGELIANEKFGTVTLLSKQPFKVEYRLSGLARWSDGVAVDASDLMLSWLAAKNPLDSGFDSIRKASGFAATTAVPTVSKDNLAITVTFDHPVVDWQSVLTIDMAAHVVEKAAATKVINAAANANSIEQQALAKAYSEIALVTQFNTTNANFRISAGPYAITNIKFGESIRLTANSEFTWGELPKVQTVVIKFYSDSTAMLAAMQTGAVDVAVPEESGIATIQDLTTLAKAAGATSTLQTSHHIESVLLNRSESSVFSELNQKPEIAAALRKAFLNLVPQAKIVAAAGSGIQLTAAQSFVFASDSKYYQPSIQANGSSQYLIQDAEKAAELVESTKLRTPVTVRVLFDSDNPRAKVAWTLISQYSMTSGFELVDESSQDPSLLLKSGEFDVYISDDWLAGELGGRAGQFTENSAIKFVSPAIDNLLLDLSNKTEALDQIAVLKQIDAELFKGDYGIPLFQVPSMVTVSKRVKTLVAAPFGQSATWGYWTWSVPSEQ